jgi:BirA family biotin operon repressor/biotin-[acetyl-CoA-carboxylase] ligase
MPDEPTEPGADRSSEASEFADLDRPPLSADALIRALLGDGSRWKGLNVLPQTASTNAVAARIAADDPGADGIVVIAEHQTAGRGRLDRAWEAPPRAGITMSALIRPAVASGRWPWLPLLSGLAAAAALQRTAGVPASLKWPNDVMVADRKIGGILVERIEVADSAPAAVIGIGLNVSQRTGELPVADATSLALEAAETLDRSVIVKSVLRSLGGLLERWESASGDVAGLHEAYTEACSTLGRSVRVSLPGGDVVTGVAEAIDDTGRLVVRTDDGVRAVGAGDVLHVRAQT